MKRFALLLLILALGALAVTDSGRLSLFSALRASDQHPLDEALGAQAPPASPEVLLRRMSLQLRGNIPSAAEVERIRTSPDSIANFAASFLRDPEFAQYWGTYFASVLRDQTRGRKMQYGSFLNYLAQSLHQNKPYDVWTTEILTAKGSPDQNPAVGFYLRDGADPLQAAEYVGRVFYGERVGCARCHDHPYMKFSRRDYYGLAAFFSQQFEQRNSWDPTLFDGKVVPREFLENLPESKRKEMEEKWRDWHGDVWNKMSKEDREAYRKKFELQYATLYFSQDLGIRFPRSDDSPGGDLVKPRFLDGTVPKLREGEDRRAVFAAWLIKQERFRKVLINRVWTRLMGWSFFTPLDDWNDSTKVQNEEVLNHLDRVFVEKQMKIKDLIYYIVTSKAYARMSPRPGDKDAVGSTRYFQPQRLDPDQLMNSVLRASGALSVRTGELAERSVPGSDRFKGEGNLLPLDEKAKEFSNAFQVPRPADDRTILAVFGSGDRMDVADDDKSITVEQVLTLMNGRFTGRLSWDYGKSGSYIASVYDQTKDMDRVYDAVFASVLSRSPTPDERARLKSLAAEKVGREKGDYRPEFMQDIIWAMFNSQEFLHVR